MNPTYKMFEKYIIW